MQAILTVLGRRRLEYERKDQHLYLTGAYLGWVDLRQANLHGAYLGTADLSRARLEQADLSDARLFNADLSGADLNGAILHGTDLRYARLDSTFNLTQAQVDEANGNDKTLLPQELHLPANWHK